MFANSPVIKRAGPLEYFSAENVQAGTVTTNDDNSIWVTGLSLPFTLDEAGSVEINANCKWNYNSAANNGRVRLVIDGAPWGRPVELEPKDVAGDDPPGTGSDQKTPGPFKAVLALAAGAHTAELQVQPQNNGTDCSIFDCVITAERKT